MGQKGFHFNASRCTGCKTCMFACKDYYNLTTQFSFRQVYEYGGGAWEQDDQGCWHTDAFVYYVSIACNHCDDAICIKVCPTGAMHKDDNGLVSVNVERCIGCGYCELACPYRAPKVDRTAGHSVKCTGCADRVAEGLRPICVEACPLRALEFDDIESLRKKYGGNANLAPLPDSSSTSPNLVITAPKNGQDTEGAWIINENEII